MAEIRDLRVARVVRVRRITQIDDELRIEGGAVVADHAYMHRRLRIERIDSQRVAKIRHDRNIDQGEKIASKLSLRNDRNARAERFVRPREIRNAQRCRESIECAGRNQNEVPGISEVFKDRLGRTGSRFQYGDAWTGHARALADSLALRRTETIGGNVGACRVPNEEGGVELRAE